MDYDIRENVVRYQFPLADQMHVVFAMVIPERLPPSFNDLMGKTYAWKNNQRKWFQHFMSAKCQALPTVYLEKRAVRIDLFKKSHLDDDCNLDGRSKIILDSMKQLGMIVDDNNKWLDWGRVFQRKSKVNATVILLSETLSKELLTELGSLSVNALELVTNGTD